MQCSHAQLVYNSKCLLQCCQWNIAAQGSSLANAIVDDTSEVALLHDNDIFMGPKLKVCFTGGVRTPKMNPEFVGSPGYSAFLLIFSLMSFAMCRFFTSFTDTLLFLGRSLEWRTRIFVFVLSVA